MHGFSRVASVRPRKREMSSQLAASTPPDHGMAAPLLSALAGAIYGSLSPDFLVPMTNTGHIHHITGRGRRTQVPFVPGSTPFQHFKGTLIVCVESAHDLANLDLTDSPEAGGSGGSDPFVAVFIGQARPHSL